MKLTMNLTLISLAISTIFCASSALASPDDNKDNRPLTLGQTHTEDSLIVVKDVVISGATGDNEVLLKTYARSKLVNQGAKSIKDFQAVAAEMTDLFFHKKGFELSRVYLPIQTLDEQHAVLKLSVLQGKYGSIHFKGAEDYNVQLIQNRFGVNSGEELETKRLERGLLLVDDLPGLKVAGVDAIPGKNTGESDYTVNLTEQRKWNATILGDNEGPDATGKNRYTGRFSWENPTGNGDELEGGITKSGKGLTSSQLSYSVPFSFGDTQGWKASFSGSKVNYRLVQPSVTSLDAYGTAEGGSFGLTYPIIRSQATNVGFSTQANYQKLTDYLLGAEFSKKTSQSLATGFAGDAQRNYSEKMGTSIFNWSATTTFGNLAFNNDTAKATDALGPKLEGAFIHINASGSVVQTLNNFSPRLSTYLSFTGQYTNSNLDSSEKFVITGPTAVRGYQQGVVSVDSGLVATAEMRYNLSNQSSFQSTVYGFYDYGTGQVYAKSYSSAINSQSVSAVGIGVKAEHRNGLFASFSLSKGYGYKADVGTSTKDNKFAWLQVGYHF